jgi:hypothetical protein
VAAPKINPRARHRQSTQLGSGFKGEVDPICTPDQIAYRDLEANEDDERVEHRLLDTNEGDDRVGHRLPEANEGDDRVIIAFLRLMEAMFV